MPPVLDAMAVIHAGAEPVWYPLQREGFTPLQVGDTWQGGRVMHVDIQRKLMRVRWSHGEALVRWVA